MPPRAPVVMVLVWVGGAVLATTVGLVAVRQVADEVGDSPSNPLSALAIQDALASLPPLPIAKPTPTRTTAGPSPSAPPSGRGAVRTITTVGGLLGAACDGEPELIYATPSEGYRTERLRAAGVRFVGSRQVVTVTLSCRERVVVEQVRISTVTTPPSKRPTPTPTAKASPDDDGPDPEVSESVEPPEIDEPEVESS